MEIVGIFFALLFVFLLIWASFKDEADKKQRRRDRDRNRDSEVQNEPYVYSIGQHGNEALALRYGIVNRKQSSSLPSSKIKIQKTEKIGDDKYKVKLVDFGDKDAVVIHEPGTDYIKTFYPLNEEWFTEHNDLETALKNTGSFTLKELAKFHIDTLIAMKSRS